MNIYAASLTAVTMGMFGTTAYAGGPVAIPSEPAAVALLQPLATARRWEVTLGAGVTYKPDYEGSDEMEASPFPFLSLRYGRVSVGPDTIGFEAWGNDHASLELSLGYGGGRDPEDIDSGALDGFNEIDDTAILGAEFTYEVGRATLFANFERYLGESDGTSLELGARHEADVSERLSIFASASATVSDDNYMERYFGVTTGEAAASGYDAYEAGAGLRRVDLNLGASYALSERWMLQGEVGAGKLLGDAGDSPIVLDDIQPEAMLVVGFRF